MILDQEAAGRGIEIIGQEELWRKKRKGTPGLPDSVAAPFYNPAHQRIYEVILDLYNEQKAIDLTTLAEELERRGELETVGGAGYLRTIVRSVATTALVDEHARIVKDKANRRSLIQTCWEIMEKSQEGSEKTEFLLQETERLIFEIAQNHTHKGFVHADQIVHESLENIEKSYKNKSAVTGIDTGYAGLNRLTTGFQRSDLIILAARPSVGKTSLALNVASNVAVDRNLPVGVFSLEMSSEQVVRRFLCGHARVNLRDTQTGFVSHEAFGRLAHSANTLMSAPIYIDDTPGISMTDLRTRARRLANEVGKLSLLVVDYIQLASGGDRIENRQQEVALISRQLKGIARDLNVPVLAVSQLSRGIERRDDPMPRLSDLRESGAIEQDADMVMFVHRNPPKSKKKQWGKDDDMMGEAEGLPTSEDDQTAWIILAKNRNGPVGKIPMTFIKEYTRFEDVAIVSEDDIPPPF
jgi:replicative DNA helicase